MVDSFSKTINVASWRRVSSFLIFGLLVCGSLLQKWDKGGEWKWKWFDPAMNAAFAVGSANSPESEGEYFKLSPMGEGSARPGGVRVDTGVQ
jgi:hypothetical protein